MSARSPGSHPEPEQLDLLLDGAASAQVREHAAACPSCTDFVGELRQVRELLGAARQVGDEAFPSDLGQRIADRLAQEGLGGRVEDGWDAVPDFTVLAQGWSSDPQASTPHAAPHAAAASVHRLPTRSRRRIGVWFAAAASVAVVAVGAGVLINRQESSTAGAMSVDSSVSAAPSAAPSPAGGGLERQNDSTGESAASSSGQHGLSDLGRSAQELRTAIATAGHADVGPLAAAPGDTTACQRLADSAAGSPHTNGSAQTFSTTWDGTPVALVVETTPSQSAAPAETAYVLDAACLSGSDSARVLHLIPLS